MIVECPKCHTKYKLPDEKIRSSQGPIKVRCKKCGNIITIQGEQQSKPPVEEEASWYVANQGSREGPYTSLQLKELFKNKKINEESFVWKAGFDSWKKLKDVAELKFVMQEDEPVKAEEEDVEETQMLSSEVIKKLTGEFQPLSESDAEEKKKEEDEGLVWQRHESSVLFSLDNYRPGLKSVDGGDSVLDLGEQTSEQKGESEKEVAVGLESISLEDQELAKVKEVLESANERKKKFIIFGIIGVIVVVIGVGAFLMLGKGGSQGQQNQTNNNKAVAMAPKKEAKKQEKKEAKPREEKKVVEKKKAAETAEAKKPVVAQKNAVVAKDTVTQQAKKEEKNTNTKVANNTPKPKKATVSHKKTAVSKKVASKPPVMVKRKAKHTKKAAINEAQAILQSLKKGKQKKHVTATSHKSNENIPKVLPTAVLNKVFKRAIPRIRKCLLNAGIGMDEHPFVRVKVKIAGSGVVQSVSVNGRVGDAKGCISNVIKGLRFNRFKDPSMNASYPYVF